MSSFNTFQVIIIKSHLVNNDAAALTLASFKRSHLVIVTYVLLLYMHVLLTVLHNSRPTMVSVTERTTIFPLVRKQHAHSTLGLVHSQYVHGQFFLSVRPDVAATDTSEVYVERGETMHSYRRTALT